MDPDEALRQIRLTIAQLRVEDAKGQQHLVLGTFVQHARDLAELIEGLDGWITGGGFLPGDWADDSEKEKEGRS